MDPRGTTKVEGSGRRKKDTVAKATKKSKSARAAKTDKSDKADKTAKKARGTKARAKARAAGAPKKSGASPRLKASARTRPGGRRKGRTGPDRYLELHRVKPGARVDLAAIDPAGTPGAANRDQAREELEALKCEMADLQELLWADHRFSVLAVFQAMDAGGKDGCIRQVTTGLNPQGVHVTSFKAPSYEDLQHDYLWRVHHAAPRYGHLGIFNRSHYEDVLIVRVRSLVPRAVWSLRYDQINHFERHLHENRTVIVKFFLHISRAEQEKRFLKRLLNPHKNWKFLPEDLAERARWKSYMTAYQEALSRCSTHWAPWFVIPADNKWYRDIAVARILAATLRSLPLDWPEPTASTREMARQARAAGRLPRLG